MINQKQVRLAGIDNDTTEQLIEDGSYLNLMNGRIDKSEYGKDERIETIPGTTLVTQNVYSPYGTNYCLGSVIHEGRNRIIYFLWNSFGNHGIFAYDMQSGVTYAIVYDSQITGGLNFQKNSRIDRNAKIVGDLLYWTDNYNQPAKINMEAGIKANLASYSTTVTPYTFPINYKSLRWIKRAPIYPMTSTKATDSTFQGNFIQDSSFLFTYFYISSDNEYSALANYGGFQPYNNYGLPTQTVVEVLPAVTVNYPYFNGYKETYNNIVIKVPFTEQIDQETQQVCFCAKIGNDGNTIIIKTFDKRNTADNLAIANHNNSIAQLSYTFYNNQTSTPLDSTSAANSFDNVPLLVKTVELAKNRLFAGNILSGYTAPVATSLTALLTATNVTGGFNASSKCFRAGSKYGLCVTFYDEFKRPFSAVTSSNAYTPNTTRTYDGATATGWAYTSLGWTLDNTNALTEIPAQAYYYSIDMTKNLTAQSFQQFASFSEISYAEKNADGTFVYHYGGNYLSWKNLYGIAIDITNYIRLGFGYTYSAGDVCNLYFKGVSTPYTLPVIAQSGNYIYLQITDVGTLNLPTTAPPTAVWEIYTPYKTSDNENFYSQGNMYAITNPTLNTRAYATTSGSFTGDCYCYFWVSSSPAYTVYIEAPSWNINKYFNWQRNLGFTNIKTFLGQQSKSTAIAYTNTFITGTNVNGLNKFASGNSADIGGSSGGIQKLQLTNKQQEDGTVMLVICDSDTLSAYLSEVQLVAASTNSSVATATNVIGTINPLRNGYGTQNPESVVLYFGLVFWIDVYNGVVVQYSSNGLEPVSSYKMDRFFKRYCKNYVAASTNNLDNINGFHHIPGCIDPFYRNYMVTLPGLIYPNYAPTLPSYSSVPSYASSINNRFDVYDGLAKTMSYDFDDNRWKSYFEFMPEWMEFFKNVMYGFKNGALYIHNSNTSQFNTFYGVQYPLRFCFTPARPVSEIKDVMNIAVEGNVTPDYTVLYTQLPNTQITDLTSSDYTNKEGVVYAPFYRDRLSPNYAGSAEAKMYHGDVIKSKNPLIMVELQQFSNLVYINFIDVEFDESYGQKKILIK
jgi:hypothetical protein